MPRLAPAVLALLLAANAAGEASALKLRLVDDRGEVISSEVQVCVQIETRMECSSHSGGLIELTDVASSVRVEGPEHGPASLKRGTLAFGGDGTAIFKVPRKAFLSVAGKPGTRTAISLYHLDDATFRAPWFRGGNSGCGGRPHPGRRIRCLSLVSWQRP